MFLVKQKLGQQQRMYSQSLLSRDEHDFEYRGFTRFTKLLTLKNRKDRLESEPARNAKNVRMGYLDRLNQDELFPESERWRKLQGCRAHDLKHAESSVKHSG